MIRLFSYLFIVSFLALLAFFSAACHGQTTGDYYFLKWDGTKFVKDYHSPNSTDLLAFDGGGNISNLPRSTFAAAAHNQAWSTITGTPSTLAGYGISDAITAVAAAAAYQPLDSDLTSIAATGNAATATALQTARNINGTAFDGTANITVTAAADTLTGSTLASGITASSLTSLGTLSSLGVDGVGTITRSSLGTTTTTGLLLQNATAAAAGAQQVSPSLTLTGQGWKTTSTAASQSAAWNVYTLPVQGSSAPTSQLKFDSIINTGAASNAMIVHSSGQVQAMGGNYNVPSLLPSAAVTNMGIGSGSSAIMHFIVNGGAQMLLSQTSMTINGNFPLAWGSGGALGNSDGSSLVLYRNGDNWLQQGADSATPAEQKLGSADGSGTNITGAGYIIHSGRGTGSAAGGPIRFQTSTGGSSGTTLGTLADRVVIQATGVVEIKEAATVPSSNPTGAGYLYIESGSLKFRGSSGTITTLAVP